VGDYELMSDSQLMRYVPDVYQKNIYLIDYSRLLRAGVKLISFDVDDTVAMMEEPIPPEKTVRLFRRLKGMGFQLVLMSNNKSKMRSNIFSSILNTDYISNAGKPGEDAFRECQNLYYLQHHEWIQPQQMAHVGNNLIKDIGGGNAFGEITCLVRRMGNLAKPFHTPLTSEAHALRSVLKERGIWRKHHLYSHHDQYYQLGENPPYKKRGV